MKAITLGKNSKGEWAVIHSPEVPIGEQHHHFDEANLKALPTGFSQVLMFQVDPIRTTIGPDGVRVEQEAAKRRADEKAEIQKRLDLQNAGRLAAVDPVAAEAEINRIKAEQRKLKATPAAAVESPKAEAEIKPAKSKK
jgi:hypothetical protein